MNIRSMWIGVLLVLLAATSLWGIWVFESRSAAKASSEGTAEFSYQLTAGPDQGDVMFMCAEDVMNDPGEAFAQWLKLDGTPVQLPGGVMVLARLNDVTIDESLKPLERSVVEILKRYSPRRVVLVAHTYCIYYDTLAAWNNNLNGVRQREIDDLQAAIQVLRKWFPRAEISGYLAEEDADHRLTFHSADKLTP
jgi:hypothetical protein